MIKSQPTGIIKGVGCLLISIAVPLIILVISTIIAGGLK